MDAFSKVIPKKIKLSDYTTERTLGTGSFGRVKLAKNKTNGKYVAIKILKKAEIIKDKFDKMLDDAGRKAGLIDAPTDPTKPIGISDSEVADIMSKLTGGNKTVI